MTACHYCGGIGTVEGVDCLRCSGTSIEPVYCGALGCKATAQFLVRGRYFCRKHYEHLRSVAKEAGLSMPESEEIER